MDEWEISTDDVIVDELLGEGAFGEVYKGVIRGPLENPKISAVLRQAIGVPVAIKLLKSEFNSFHATHIQEECVYKHIAPSTLHIKYCWPMESMDTFMCPRLVKC